MKEEAQSGRYRRWRFRHWRLATLSLAFLVIAVNPLVNYFFQNNFVQGWYQSIAIGKLWFVSPLEGVESILIGKAIYAPALIGMLVPLVLAFFLGRVFCSWICPLTLMLQGIDHLRRGRWASQAAPLPRRTLWFVLIAELLFSMILGAPLFVIFSPPGLIGREIMMLVFFRTLAFEGVLIVMIMATELYRRRLFCRFLCPLGALLALVGSGRRLKVRLDAGACVACGRCAETCPMGLQPDAGEAASPYCWNCGDCVDHCPTRALGFRWRQAREN